MKRPKKRSVAGKWIAIQRSLHSGATLRVIGTSGRAAAARFAIAPFLYRQTEQKVVR
jgi:hypothetical protein